MGLVKIFTAFAVFCSVFFAIAEAKDDLSQLFVNIQEHHKDDSDDSDYDERFDDENSLIAAENAVKPASYGSCGSSDKTTDDDGIVVTMDDRVTYAWRELDVFGEQKPEDFWKRMRRTVGRVCPEQLGGGKYEYLTRKHLLKSVTGIAKGGEMLAVLGSSGAGKTTLLNALAFRSPPGIKVNGSRTINGFQVDATQMRTQCAYVQQDDLFIGSLTVREHLICQALLRMNRKISYKQKLARVDAVINELSLKKCAHTVIGVPGRTKGLSGGERKRLSFASEALTDPHLMLCDEPTSGLDSFMAFNVIMVLKKLCMKGKTIILTIHQPSSEIFSLFDKILLMAEGRVAFLGQAHEAKEFFTFMGKPCPHNYNPADYYVQMLAIEPNWEQKCRDTIKKVCDAFAVSHYAREIGEEAARASPSSDKTSSMRSSNGKVQYRATWWTQFLAILWRSWLNVVKEPMLIKVRLLQTGMVALLIGVIFYGQILDQDGVMNINGALFLFLTSMTFQNLFATINVFSGELPIFLRESKARLYRVDTYFLGKTIAELPLFLTVPIMFTAIAYPLIGLHPGAHYFAIAVTVVALVANVATSFGYLISCASSNVSMALSVGPPVIIPFLIFGGFFLNTASVPSYFLWLSYMSWFRYGNEALLINQWADVSEGDIICTRSNSTCPSSGNVVLETYNFTANDFYWDVGALFCLIVLFRALSLICLKYRSSSKE